MLRQKAAKKKSRQAASCEGTASLRGPKGSEMKKWVEGALC